MLGIELSLLRVEGRYTAGKWRIGFKHQNMIVVGTLKSIASFATKRAYIRRDVVALHMILRGMMK